MEDLSGRELLEAFVGQYKSGAQGCQMDYDTAQAMALEIERLHAFVDDAFEAHSNLDLDVDRVRGGRESEEANLSERKTIPEWLEDAFEEISGLRNDVIALNQELVELRRELDTERRLRLGGCRKR